MHVNLARPLLSLTAYFPMRSCGKPSLRTDCVMLHAVPVHVSDPRHSARAIAGHMRNCTHWRPDSVVDNTVLEACWTTHTRGLRCWTFESETPPMIWVKPRLLLQHCATGQSWCMIWTRASC